MSATQETTSFASPSEAGPASPPETQAGTPQPKAVAGLPFDPWRLLAALLHRWHVILVASIAVGGLAGLGGYLKLTTSYTASAQLMRQEPSATFRASELGEPFKPRQLTVATLVSFMKSPTVLQRVAEQAQLPVRAIVPGLKITPERNTDLINLTFATARSAQTAVRVLNAFGQEVVRLTRDMQSQEASEMNRLLKRQLAKAEEDLRAVNREQLDFAQEAGLVSADKEIDAYLRSLGDLDLRYETARIDFETLDLKIAALEKELTTNNSLTERIRVARERLTELRQQYTDANPLVEEQKAVVVELEARQKEATDKPIAAPQQGDSGLATTFYAELLNLKTQKAVTASQLEKLKTVRANIEQKLHGLPEKGMQLARIKARQQSLEASQSLLASRQREAQLYEDNPMEYYRFFESKMEEVESAGRSKKLILLTIVGGILGLVSASALVCLIESLDNRVKTSADLRRVTRLPLLASLPDLEALDAVAQSNWAFHTWLALQARLATGSRREVVCGLVSAGRQEGCSTWVELLARAAGQRNQAVLAVTNRAPLNGNTMPLDQALADPSCLSPAAGSVLWLVAPGDWRWNAQQRRRWQAAMDIWSRTEGLVVLVELAAADQPETLLFAEDLPQVIWLSGSGLARANDITARLQNFQHAGCHFAGAALNREKKLFPWL